MAGLIQIDSEAIIEACKSVEEQLAMIKTLAQGIASQRENSGYLQGDVDYQDVQNSIDEMLECLEDNRVRLVVDIKILKTFAWIMKCRASDGDDWKPPAFEPPKPPGDPDKKKPKPRRKKGGGKSGHPGPADGTGGGGGSGESGSTAFGSGGSATGGVRGAVGLGVGGGSGSGSEGCVGAGSGSGTGSGFGGFGGSNGLGVGSGFGLGGAMPSSFGFGNISGLGGIAGALSNASTGIGMPYVSIGNVARTASTLSGSLDSALSGGLSSAPTQPIAAGTAGVVGAANSFGIPAIAGVIGSAAAALGAAAVGVFGAVGIAALINAAKGSPALLVNNKAVYPLFRTVPKKMKKAIKTQGAVHG